MAIDQKKIGQIEDRSEHYKDILERIPSKIIFYGNVSIAIVLLLFAIGIRFIKYPEAITCETIVTTDYPSIEVYSKTSARIARLFKVDQDKVKAGDWVILLANSARYEDINRLEQALNQIDSLGFWKFVTIAKMPDLLNLGDLEDVYYSFYKSVNELALFNQLSYQKSQLLINGNRETYYDSMAKQLTDQIAISERQLTIQQADYNRNYKLAQDSVVSISDLGLKEMALLQSKSNLQEIKNNIINARLQIESLRKENGTLINDQITSSLTYRRNAIQNYYKLVYALSEWKNKYVLQAPIDGSLSLFDIRSSHQFLTNEQKAFTISPVIASKYFGLAKLPIARSGKVKVGQKCRISLTDYPSAEFGILQGEVESISSASKEGYYNVRIALPKQLYTNINRALYPKIEFNGQTDIVTDDLTLFDRLFKSLLNKNY